MLGIFRRFRRYRSGAYGTRDRANYDARQFALGRIAHRLNERTHMNKLSNSAAALIITVVSLSAITSAAIAPAIAQGTQQVVTSIDVRAIALGYRSSKIGGSAVVNEKGDTVGKIDDLIISKDRQALYAILSVGGYLGMGSKLIAVRYEDLRPTTDDKGFVLAGATKDGLNSMPEFVYAR